MVAPDCDCLSERVAGTWFKRGCCTSRRIAFERFALLFNAGALLLIAAGPAAGQEHPVPEHRCTVLVVAFVGGLGTAHFPPSTALPIVHRLESREYPGVCVKQFSAYCPWCAHRWIKKQFARKLERPRADDPLRDEPKVILYGYSLGGPSALYFARLLDRDGIPIEFAITVDAKGFTRGVIPKNVKVAVNFYETEFLGLFSGRHNLVAEDPQATRFLGNFQLTHYGHLRIAGSAPVQNLLLSTTRAVAYSMAYLEEAPAPAAANVRSHAE